MHVIGILDRMKYNFVLLTIKYLELGISMREDMVPFSFWILYSVMIFSTSIHLSTKVMNSFSLWLNSIP